MCLQGGAGEAGEGNLSRFPESSHTECTTELAYTYWSPVEDGSFDGQPRTPRP